MKHKCQNVVGSSVRRARRPPPLLPPHGLITDLRPIAACLRRGRPRRSWQNPNSRHLFIALDVLDAALLCSKVGVSRPYDSGRGFRARQGSPMPSGLYRLDRTAPPLAIALAVTWSYHVTAGIALLLYVAATLLLPRFPAKHNDAAP